MIKILIADDHKLIRETWTYILNNDTDSRFKVIASCENGEDAVAMTSQRHPDVILMDINMAPSPEWKPPGGSGKSGPNPAS